MEPTEVIFFVSDIRRITKHPRDILERFNVYAVSLKENSPNSKFVLIVNGLAVNELKDFILKYPLIEFINMNYSGYNIFKQTFFLQKYLKNNKNRKIILPSNLYDNFATVLTLKYLYKLKIQVAIHGEINQLGISFNIIKIFKMTWLKLSLRFADSIRVVSIVEKQIFFQKYRIELNKIVVCPIPIIGLDLRDIPMKTTKSIAFIGRFHEERDPIFWAQIVTNPILLNYSITVYAIGSGGMKSQFLTLLRKNSALKVISVDSIPQSELQFFWPKIGLLISTAPSEGYGMAIREALLNKTYVLARKSNGAELLKNVAGENTIHIFESSFEATNLLVEYLNNNWEDGNFSKFIDNYETETKYFLVALTKSWVKSYE